MYMCTRRCLPYRCTWSMLPVFLTLIIKKIHREPKINNYKQWTKCNIWLTYVRYTPTMGACDPNQYDLEWCFCHFFWWSAVAFLALPHFHSFSKISTGFQTIVRTNLVPSLVKIHWVMLITNRLLTRTLRN